MGNHHRVLTEREKPGQYRLNIRRVEDHAVVDARQVLDFIGNRRPGIDKGAETVRYPAALHPHRADLDNLILQRAEARGLNIKYHAHRVQGLALSVADQLLHIVNQIALHTVEHLKILVLIYRVAGVRERLDTAVICHRDRVHAPLFCALYEILYLRHAVHIAHFRMTVKLHPLDRTVVHTAVREILTRFNARNRSDGQLPVEAVKIGHPLDAHKPARLRGLLQILHRLLPGENLHGNGVRKIADIAHKERIAAAQLPALGGKDLPTDHNRPDLSLQLIQLHRLPVKVTAVQHIRMIRFFILPETAILPAAAFCARSGRVVPRIV